MDLTPKEMTCIEDAFECPYCESKAEQTSYEDFNDEGNIIILYECEYCDAYAELEFSWKEGNATAYDGEFLFGLWWPPTDTIGLPK